MRTSLVSDSDSARMRLFVLGSFVYATCVQVPRLPLRGESLAATALHQGPGGKGFNVAVAARRLGAEVDVVIAAGEDAHAESAAQALVAEGLSSRHLLRLQQAPTGQGVGFIDPAGENCIAIFSGANLALDAVHVAALDEAIAQADLVCAQFEIGDAPVLEAFQRAHAHGVRTLLNPSPWRLPRYELLALTDVLVVNGSEAAALLDLPLQTFDEPEATITALEGRALPVATLVITLGARGCVARDATGRTYHQPGFAVPSVDSTGAGDAFTAALAVALAEALPLDAALRRACAGGALTCTRLGVLEALPAKTAVEALLVAS